MRNIPREKNFTRGRLEYSVAESMRRCQFVLQAPPQQPPGESQESELAEDDEPTGNTAAGMDISFFAFFEPHEGQTMSSAISRVLW